MTQKLRDIFICHASEDKDELVRPMVEAFNLAGISCWYDEAEIQWGDSITQKVNEGLRMSRFVVVVFSPTFLRKNWPQRELNAVMNQEASSGEVKVLPLLVGSEQEKRRITESYPLLNDKRFLPWDGNLRNVVETMLVRLGRKNMPDESSTPTRARSRPEIPMPHIKKVFTQRDRDMFLRNAFTIVKQYFQDALAELKRHDQDVDTNFDDIHAFKFQCMVYVRGDVANCCKIWLGGLTTSNSIVYQSGHTIIDSDNSFNDMLTIADDDRQLGFRCSGIMSYGPTMPKDGLLSAEDVAEYLWRRLTENLG